MTTINPYLTFNGTCEEAFNFYKSVFGGDFPYVGKFKDMPENPDFPVSEAPETTLNPKLKSISALGLPSPIATILLK